MCLDSTPCPRCARPALSDLRPAHSSRDWCLGDRTPLDHRGPHGTRPLCGGGQRRARCGPRIHCTRQHAHQPLTALVTDALARRMTEHHLPWHSSSTHWRGAGLSTISRCVHTRTIHVAVLTPRSHVAKCSIFMVRGPSRLLLSSASSILAHHQHPYTCSRTHPQHASRANFVYFS